MNLEAFTLVFDDYVADEYGEWTQICDNHLARIRDNEPDDVNKHVRLQEGMGLCGVKGCIDLADHYVDF